MNEIVLAVLGSGVISTIISCIFQYLSDKKAKQAHLDEKIQLLEKGISLLLLSALKRDGNDLRKKGNISKNDYDSFEATYKAYKALDGDGWADGIKAKVDALERDCTD